MCVGAGQGSRGAGALLCSARAVPRASSTNGTAWGARKALRLWARAFCRARVSRIPGLGLPGLYFWWLARHRGFEPTLSARWPATPALPPHPRSPPPPSSSSAAARAESVALRSELASVQSELSSVTNQLAQEATESEPELQALLAPRQLGAAASGRAAQAISGAPVPP